MRPGSFPAVKRPGRGVDNPPHSVPWLKKVYRLNPTPPLGLCGLSRVDYLYVYLSTSNRYIPVENNLDSKPSVSCVGVNGVA
jgi:hypothetical protein